MKAHVPQLQHLTDRRTAQALILPLVALLTLAGCGKREETTQPSTTAAPPPPQAATAPVNSKPAPIAGPAQPVQWMDQARTYQQAGDYDKAAEYLLQVQQQQRLLNQQQSAAYWKQMTDFQASLSARVASGDPNAKAAAERLRASTLR